MAPILVSVLVGAGQAILTTLIISVVFGILGTDRVFLVAFLSGIVGTVKSHNIRKRSQLVRAGLLAGATAAIAGATIALLNDFSVGLIRQQTIITLIVGRFANPRGRTTSDLRTNLQNHDRDYPTRADRL